MKKKSNLWDYTQNCEIKVKIVRKNGIITIKSEIWDWTENYEKKNLNHDIKVWTLRLMSEFWVLS